MIAAIATVATLAYLAIQIRANTNAVTSESRRGSAAQTITISALLVNNKEAASVFRRGLADYTTLDADEQLQLTNIFAMYMQQASNMHEEYALGIIDSRTLQGLEPILRFLKSSGGQRYWATQKGYYTPEFREYVEGKLARGAGGIAAQQSAAADSA